ncbi:TetR/AcrR family transcriptional regulator [Halalkalibacter okhensis]|uniref:TetR family transcriptional regulator n=1 Tax=Halalkalibacter okhensis TaxID=333138 RepID=A0A0B0IJX6_9BACI|nr:TetR/AcrR family transcriptional regulator [Halalkalibacter okhensis]KHF41630.1 TetR family transcriptional regulator [Halalkalibacter okhensis]
MAKEKENLTARERQAIQTRNNLLKAGKAIFLENGFQKATISQMIKRANTGYGTAYVYFKNKDDLFIVLMEEVMDKFYQVAEKSFEPKTKKEAQEQISEQVRLFLMLAVEEKAMMGVVKEAIGVSSEVEQRWNVIRERFIERIAVDVRYSQQYGLADPSFHPALVARGWFYANEMFMWDCVKGDNPFSVDDVIMNLTKLYMDGLY